jgi:hypothetical protein
MPLGLVFKAVHRVDTRMLISSFAIALRGGKMVTFR